MTITSVKLPSVIPLILPAFVIAGPVLLFPDLLPSSWRWATVTILALMAVGTGVTLLHPWRRTRSPLLLFGLAVAASWLLTGSTDLPALRHLGGIGLGLLATALVATWCASSTRLLTIALVCTVAAGGVLTLGLTAATISQAKFVGGPTGASGWLAEVLPSLHLRLPGVESGRVNPNALAGTALLFLPFSIAVAFSASRLGRGRWTAVVAGGWTGFVAVLVLASMHSRTALLALGLTAVVVSLHYRRTRVWIWTGIALATAGLAIASWSAYRESPHQFGETIQVTKYTYLQRAAIWRQGTERLLKHPLLGIGLYQFHDVALPNSVYSPADPVTRVAHAHNTLIQVALDIGVPGLVGYVWLLGSVLLLARDAARRGGPHGHLAIGAAYSIIAVHFFGLADAIALGAKVGLFQWLYVGLILAAYRTQLEELGPVGRQQGQSHARHASRT